MKRAYLLNGNILNTILVSDNTLVIDAASYAYLSSLLGGNDYCYAVLGGKEVIKILGVGNLIEGVRITDTGMRVVDSGNYRGVDFTHSDSGDLIYIQRNCPQVWLAGTTIQYKITPNEVADAVAIVNLTLTQGSAIQVKGQTVYYPNISVVSINGIKTIGNGVDFILQGMYSYECNNSALESIPANFLAVRITDSSNYRVVEEGYRTYG